MHCEILADAGCGTIGFYLEPAAGAIAVAYVRVIPNGGGAEVLFAQLQSDRWTTPCSTPRSRRSIMNWSP